jgi:cytochrome c oxidase assembly factor CtaG
MMKAGDANFSNKMMQLRVLLQFVAVVLIVLAIYFGRPS